MADETGETKRDSKMEFKSHLQLYELCILRFPILISFGYSYSPPPPSYGLLHLKLAKHQMGGLFGECQLLRKLIEKSPPGFRQVLQGVDAGLRGISQVTTLN